MQYSPIEWTHFTANPLKYRDPDGNIVHACIHKSGGCLHCYAESLAGRWGRKGLPFTAENMKRLTPFLDEKELHHMLTHKPASGKMCFVGDMTDIFGEWVPDELIDQLFAVFAMRPDVTWQVLTKRADRMRRWATYVRETSAMMDQKPTPKSEVFNWAVNHWAWTEQYETFPWPLPNVWLGTSAEDLNNYRERVVYLANTPAAVRFVSFEPLLSDVGDLMLDGIFGGAYQWAIVGGESGGGARPMNIEWPRSIVRQCRAANVSCFVKQMGSVPMMSEAEWRQSPTLPLSPLLNAGNHSKVPADFVPLKFNDRKGGNPSEWPDGFPREFPV